MKLDKNEIM